MIIRELEYNDIESALALSVKEFGTDFHSEKHLKKYIDSDANNGFIAIIQNQLVGLLLIEEMDGKDFKLKLKDNLAPVKFKERLEYVDTIIVNADFQKKGIASALMQKYDEMNKKTQVTAIAWKSHEGLKVGPLFLKFGYTQLNELENIWNTECNAGEYHCVFKTDVCRCTGVLFVKG